MLWWQRTWDTFGFYSWPPFLPPGQNQTYLQFLCLSNENFFHFLSLKLLDFAIISNLQKSHKNITKNPYVLSPNYPIFDNILSYLASYSFSLSSRVNFSHWYNFLNLIYRPWLNFANPPNNVEDLWQFLKHSLLSWPRHFEQSKSFSLSNPLQFGFLWCFFMIRLGFFSLLHYILTLSIHVDLSCYW